MHVGHARQATASPAGTNWRVRHVAGRKTAPWDHPTPLRCPPLSTGSPSPPGGPPHPRLAVVGRVGVFNGGHLEGGVVFPSGAAAGPGACITQQLRALAPAVPRQACGACVVRHGPAGSAPLSSYACPAGRDQSPGRPHPPSAARRYPRRRDTAPGDDHTHLRCPPLEPPIRWLSAIQGCTPAGHGRPAERHCGDGPLGIHASPNGPAAIPSGGRRGAAQISLRPTSTPRRATPADR